MNKSKYLFICAAFFISCGKQKSGCIVQGKISNLSGTDWKPVIYLDFLKSAFDIYGISSRMIMDSASITSDGSFRFNIDSLPLDGGLYRLRIIKKTDGKATLYGTFKDATSIPLILNNEDEIIITSDTNCFSDVYRVVGSASSTRLKTLKDILWESDDFWGSTGRSLRDSSYSAQTLDARMLYKAKFDSAATIFYSAYIPKLKSFADTTPHSLLSQLAITGLYGWARRNNNESMMSYIDSLCIRLSKDTSRVSSFYLIPLKEKIRADKFLPVGTMVPEILMPTPEGKPVSLYAIKGKLILLDFWASWCGPCMIENNETIKPLYEKYKDKGLTVVGVSLDHKREKWLKAIRENNFDWLQISDLKAYESEYTQAYRFNAIPQVFVLNENKMILARNLRGPELVAFVKDYMEK